MKTIKEILNTNSGRLLLDSSFNNCELDLSKIELKGSRKLSSLELLEGTENIHIFNANVNKAIGIRNSGVGNTFENCNINVYGVGLYLNSKSSHTKVISNTLSSGGVGIYLDSGTHSNLIEHNVLNKCGYKFDNGDLKFSLPRFSWLMREGIAVDDATDNTIRYNKINNCGLAGITLYRNCAEYGSYERGQGSKTNTIHDNEITNCPIDIWEDAREWRDMLMWNCGDKGQWISLKDVPKQPFQQWFNWECIIYPLFDKKLKFKNPFRTKIWKVSDIVENNTIKPDNSGKNILINKQINK